VWAADPNNVFGVWGRAAGASWSPMSVPAGVTLRGVWAGTSKELLVITKERGLLRYDGTAWAPISIGTSIRLVDIAGSGKSIFVSDEIGGVHELARAQNW
jgi:hypothetical protein